MINPPHLLSHIAFSSAMNSLCIPGLLSHKAGGRMQCYSIIKLSEPYGGKVPRAVGNGSERHWARLGEVGRVQHVPCLMNHGLVG